MLKVGVKDGDQEGEMPKLIGLSLQRAKSRLWEMGFNVGKVIYDDDIEMLDKKSARVYYQSVDYGRGAALGSRIKLKLTLDAEKVERASIDSDDIARGIIEERLRSERIADSLRNLENVAPQTPVEGETNVNTDDFFM